MAYGRLKTEMKGTGGGRYGTRAEYKHEADRLRRRIDHEQVEDGVNDFLWYREKLSCCYPFSGDGHEPDCGIVSAP